MGALARVFDAFEGAPEAVLEELLVEGVFSAALRAEERDGEEPVVVARSAVLGPFSCAFLRAGLFLEDALRDTFFALAALAAGLARVLPRLLVEVDVRADFFSDFLANGLFPILHPNPRQRLPCNDSRLGGGVKPGIFALSSVPPTTVQSGHTGERTGILSGGRLSSDYECPGTNSPATTAEALQVTSLRVIAVPPGLANSGPPVSGEGSSQALRDLPR